MRSSGETSAWKNLGFDGGGALHVQDTLLTLQVGLRVRGGPEIRSRDRTVVLSQTNEFRVMPGEELPRRKE
jgi:hypothetical protein